MSRDNLLNVRTAGSESEIVIGEYVTGNYFPVLGLKPAIGRLIGPQDASASVAVVSWSYWKTRFHLDPAILGQRIVVQDKAATIVGVTPREFFGVLVGSRTDVWLPCSAEMRLHLFGRLRPGVTLQQARAEMSVLYRFTMEEQARTSNNPLVWQTHVEVEPAGAGLGARARPLRQAADVADGRGGPAVADRMHQPGQHAAGTRGRPPAGDGRARRVGGQPVSSGAAGADRVPAAFRRGRHPGVLLAHIGIGALVRIIASGREHERFDLQVQPDLHVLVFTAGVALLTGLLFGLAPAWYAFRSAPAFALRQTGTAGETQAPTPVRKRPGGRSGGVVGRAVERCRPVRGLPVASQEPGSGLPARPRSAGDPRSGTQWYRREQLSGTYRDLLARLE